MQKMLKAGRMEEALAMPAEDLLHSMVRDGVDARDRDVIMALLLLKCTKEVCERLDRLAGK